MFYFSLQIWIKTSFHSVINLAMYAQANLQTHTVSTTIIVCQSKTAWVNFSIKFHIIKINENPFRNSQIFSWIQTEWQLILTGAPQGCKEAHQEVFKGHNSPTKAVPTINCTMLLHRIYSAVLYTYSSLRAVLGNGSQCCIQLIRFQIVLVRTATVTNTATKSHYLCTM